MMKTALLCLLLLLVMAGCQDLPTEAGESSTTATQSNGTEPIGNQASLGHYRDQIPLTVGPADVPDAAAQLNPNCAYIAADQAFRVERGNITITWSALSPGAASLRLVIQDDGGRHFKTGTSPVTLQIPEDTDGPLNAGDMFFSAWVQGFLTEASAPLQQPVDLSFDLEYAPSNAELYVDDIDSCGSTV